MGFRDWIRKALGIREVPTGFYPLTPNVQLGKAKSVWYEAGVARIATTAAQVPLKIFRGDKEASDIEQYFLRPNEFSTGREMIETIFSWLEYKGIAFILKQGNKMYVLDSDLVTVRKNEHGYIGFDFYYGANGETITYSPNDVTVFYNYSPYARLEGYSSLDILKKTIELAAYSDETGIEFFKHGGIMQGYFTTDQRLTANQAEELRKIWEARYGGMGNS